MYLLVTHDKHSDPEYRLFSNLKTALMEAEKAEAYCATFYHEDTDVYKPSCRGERGCWFIAQYEDAFKVIVVEVEVEL